jgi:hypothetical protein
MVKEVNLVGIIWILKGKGKYRVGIETKKKISCQRLSEILGNQLIQGKYKIEDDKYSDSTDRVIRIEIENKYEDVIPILVKVFKKLVSDGCTVSHHMAGDMYIEFILKYQHPFKSCENHPSGKRHLFLSDWSIFRIVNSIKDNITDPKLLSSLNRKFTDPRTKKEIRSEIRKTKLLRNLRKAKYWIAKILPKKRDYSEY